MKIQVSIQVKFLLFYTIIEHIKTLNIIIRFHPENYIIRINWQIRWGPHIKVTRHNLSVGHKAVITPKAVGEKDPNKTRKTLSWGWQLAWMLAHLHEKRFKVKKTYICMEFNNSPTNLYVIKKLLDFCPNEPEYFSKILIH